MKKAVLITNIAAVVVIIALAITFSVKLHNLPDQEAYKRWNVITKPPFSFSDIFKKETLDGNVPFAQVSVFYQNGISLDKTYQMTFDIDEKTANYVKSARKNAVAISYCTAPTTISFTAKTDIKSTSANLESYFIGGNFLLFHPYEILTGTFLSDDTVMHDNAVIDENAAWQLFGSSDVVGEYLFVGNTAIHISGVVRIPNADKGYIFLDKELSETLNGYPASFSCVEIILPNPVNGSGLTTVKTTVGITDGDVSVDKSTRVIENSSRTSLSALFGILGNINKLSAQDDAIIVPVWENRARERDTELSLLLFFLCVFTAIPVITGFAYLVKLYKFIMKKITAPKGRRI
ncbi:MAG: ABC transporter permease [Ruminococcus sp.]|jgi:hypothetical protein|nr:ABC transporter permease [Ruminococcus sp.]